jgi:uncharacterized membrane protein YbaN (DUF454 family)
MAVLIILGFIVLAAGIVGCVLPVIPGPPLAYTALILLSIALKLALSGVIAAYFLRAVLRG